MKAAWALGNAIAVTGLCLAVYYLVVTRGNTAASPRLDPAMAQTVVRIKRRRQFGAALMVLIAVMFLVAVNWFAHVHTLQMGLFWLLLMVLLLWLLVLALLDMLAIGRLRRHVLNQAKDRYRDILDPSRPKEDDETHDEGKD